MLSTVFYNQQRSGYEELLSYGPLFYRDLLEMDTNYRFAGKTLDVGAEGLEKLMQDQFIDTADEETISRWEKWLNLLPDSPIPGTPGGRPGTSGCTSLSRALGGRLSRQ